ncbi:MAG TPA: MBL fold metallo-hydrolase [Anaeromyxobacteraceae bacterium]|nr:MBL fold metallo-hydrolase [Anaeromyxobacteraceae bacterium]
MAAALMLLAASPLTYRQPRDEEGRFLNLDPTEPHGFGDVLKWKVFDWIAGRRRSSPDRAPVPAVAADRERLRRPPGPGEGARITWLGHSSFLVQLDGVSLLLDPVLEDRMGPLGLVGRNVPPALRPEELPPVDATLVTHNHYDHLDLPTLRAVGATVFAGLGNEELVRAEGLPCVSLGWWQAVAFRGVRITFVPAQHFSQRGPGDRNRTLWGGFVIEGSSATVYHAGDTAYFSGFREIGRRFPGIDAALLPIGAYDPRWFMRSVHVDPEEALLAFLDLGASTLVAMHWGTFKQTDEPLDEPPRRLEAERARRGIAPGRVRVLAVGETIEVRRPPFLDSPLSGG